MTLKSQITIQSFNPYETLFPGRRVISRDAVLFIKRLRNEGHQVTVVPDNGTKLYYLMRKGYVGDLFADPLIVFLLGVPVSFIVNVISNLVMTLWSRPKLESTRVHLILETEQDGKKTRFDYKGRKLTDSQFRSALATYRAEHQEFERTTRMVSPDPARPKPIFLEHTTKIVGWARVSLAKNGALMADSVITDDDALEAARNGTLKGYSIGGLVGKTSCSICKEDYLLCDHIAGEKYGGTECVVWLGDIEIAEISIVSDPVQVNATFSQTEKEP